jgi:hypothetical protein
MIQWRRILRSFFLKTKNFQNGENKFKHIGALTSSPETFMISPFIYISISNGVISINAPYYRRIKDQLQKAVLIMISIFVLSTLTFWSRSLWGSSRWVPSGAFTTIMGVPVNLGHFQTCLYWASERGAKVDGKERLTEPFVELRSESKLLNLTLD